ncbi:hypothetical protein DPMN_127825 [Dreissena polymorpha]|uniref:Uncharacterized protein n=1 Tax=Dreissena polymorpha TaxID=45954 RepID=A0A9D4GZP8_DREPO|nr:hypothetical protein DPMN_127825 [Dreissena polymorpha]
MAAIEYWGLDWHRNLDIVHNETNLYSTDLFAQEAVNIINKHNTSEVCLYKVCLYAIFEELHFNVVDQLA